MSAPNAGPGAALRCASHPNTETYLRCAQCQTPICPRCLVMTPVGAKCRACARARPLPTFQVSALNVVLATIAMLISSIVLGAIGSIALRVVPLFVMLFPLALGFAVGEIVSLATNRKRHLILRIIAGVGVALGYLMLVLGDFVVHAPIDLITSGEIAPMLLNALVSLVENPFLIIFIALGIWIASYRVG